MIAFLAICVLVVLPMPGRAQLISIPPGPSCQPADLDADIQFINGPGDDYAIIIDRRNVSDHTCVVSAPVVLGFVPNLAPGQLCFGCQNNSPSVPYAPLAVDPGWVVREKVSWKTTPPGRTVSCVQPEWIGGDVTVVLPSLLKAICSVVDLSPLTLVAPSDQASPEDREFELKSDKSAYYAGEWFPLRLSVNGPRTQPTEGDCPVLYLKQKSPDGAVRFDEVGPLAFQGCPQFTPGHQRGDWQSGFELDSGANSRWTGLGEHTMQVFRLTGSSADGRLNFAASNVLRIRVDDPSTINRKWGPKVKGVAVDITLDKDTYRVGEDVPLHLALENFDAPVPVYGWDPVWDPDSVFRLEVRDTAGHPLPPDQLISNLSAHMGHGVGSMSYLKGVIVPVERLLRREVGVPNHPGTYYIVLTWIPQDAPSGPGFPVSPVPAKDYAIVQAVATIHIVSNDTSQPK